MTDQKLVDELEKALRGEACDGGFGYMGDEQFTAYVRTLAETAAEVVEKAHTPTDDEREDMIAFLLRDHNFEESPWGRTYTDAEIANALRQSEGPEPSTECPQCHRPDGLHKLGCGERFGSEPQGEPSSEVPEPSAEEFRRQIAEERARQIEGGYDAEHDRAHGVDHLLRWAQDYSRRGRSVQSAALIEAAREMLREDAK